MKLDTIFTKLKENQCRITPQRRVIIETLLKHQNTLLTIDVLLELCIKENPDINTTTIYRNIELFDSLDLLYKINITRNTTAYKLICSDHHHHHVICLKCGKVIAIDYCPITPSLISLIKSKNFELVNHNLELYGYCKSCIK